MSMFLTILQCILVSLGIIEKLSTYHKTKKSADPSKKSTDDSEQE